MPKLNKVRRKGRIYARKLWCDQRPLSEDESSSEGDATKDSDDNFEFIPFVDKFNINDVGDLFEFIKDKTGLRFITVILHMTLRHFGIKWDKCGDFFKQIGVITTKTAHKWVETFVW